MVFESRSINNARTCIGFKKKATDAMHTFNLLFLGLFTGLGLLTMVSFLIYVLYSATRRRRK